MDPIESGPPVVTLRNAFARPYDGAIAAARTCYSPRVVGVEEVTASQRDSIGPLTFEAGHHTVYQHAHFEFGLQGVSRQFVWSFLHSHPFYNSEQSSQRFVRLDRIAVHVPQDLGATAHLTLADGGEALAIAVVEPSWTDYHVAYRVGARHALNQGAAGRAILLGRELAAGAEAGDRFVQTAGELQPGARGLASPVMGIDGFEASVGIVTLGDIDAEVAGPRVAAAAAEISRRLS
jgi:hypothetical protein